MTELLQHIANGIALGAIYGLIALSFSIIYKTSDVLNFGTGVMIVLGAFLVAKLTGGGSVGFVAALVIAVVATAAFGMATERVLVRPMLGRSVDAIAIMTLGIYIVGTTELTRQVGSNLLPLGDPWGTGVTGVGSLSLPDARIAAIAISLVLMAAFFVWFKYSSWGIATRAMAESRRSAMLMGIPLERMSMSAWGIAGALAAVAGVFLAAFPSPGVDASLAATALRAFPAAILGGIDSTAGAIAGGFILGISEVLVRGYAAELSFLGRGFHEVAAYVVLVIILLIRPAGLFGRSELSRV